MASNAPTGSRDPEPYFETQVFHCCNQRPEGHPRSCCADRGGRKYMEYLASRLEAEGLSSIKVTEAGCMERCELGPTIVIYPDAVWYSVASEADVDEIIDSHFRKGAPVERLVLEPDRKLPKEKAVQLLDVTVAEVRDETSDIKSYVLRAKDGELPAFEAGAHVDVMTANGHRRSYSLAGDPADRSAYLLGVLREPESRGGSVWVHENVKGGDSLQITRPLNNFPLDEAGHEHILIAGGIGITPILAMARRLSAIGAKYHLHYCTRAPEKTAFADEVTSVAGANLTMHYDGGDPSKGIKLDEVLGKRADGAHVYVCGPGGLIEATRKAASHWPVGTVHFELFAAAPPAADWTNEPFDIYLSRRRMDLTVPADRSILEVVREAGVFVDSSCEQGLCSTCEVRVISGEVEHRDQVLTDAEKARGDKILTCISRAKPGEKLVLDL